jgi:enterochelin esterase-like enzyme
MVAHIDTLGPFKAPWLTGERRVRVHVPRPLTPGARLPVLYMFDGQNIFDDAPSFAGGWHLHDTSVELARRGHTMPVIVGIDHGGRHRIDELAPFRCAASKGQLARLITWMTKTLMPQIERDYPVRTDAAGTAIGGSSLGGLAALHTHFRLPERFGAALVMSPSLWLARGKIFRDLAGRPTPQRSRIYLDAGAREGRMLRDAARLADELRRRGYGQSDLLWRPDPQGRHSEACWRRRAPLALDFLFDRGRSLERAA